MYHKVMADNLWPVGNLNPTKKVEEIHSDLNGIMHFLIAGKIMAKEH